MRIHSLELKNFRCFEHYKLSLAPRFTVLIGDNGSGKTAILDALAVAAGSFLLGIPQAVSRPIHPEEIRSVNLVLGQAVTQEEVGDTEVSAEGEVNRETVAWRRTRASSTAGTTRKYAQQLESAAEAMVRQAKAGREVIFPVLGYYGTGRLWHVLRGQAATNKRESRFAGYKDCLNPASDLKRLFRWFKTTELAALQKQERRHALEAVRSAIVAMVPDATGAVWDLDWDDLVVDVTIHGSRQRIPFHLLSDGYRNAIGMAGDIAYRMAVLNPHLLGEAVRETPGVVLIDEVDLHLHPKWQRIVVGKLLEAFPKVQFVGTTHSPFIIQSLHGRADTLLWDLVEKGPLAVESKSIEDIAEKKQGVEIPQQSQRFLDMKAAAERYYRKLEEAKHAENGELERLRRELDELTMPFSDDPAFQAFLKMERAGARVD
jgi:predicted ATP-binding protein involved in virulence